MEGKTPRDSASGTRQADYVRWEPRFPTVERLQRHKPDLFLILPNGKQLIIVKVCRDDKPCTRAEEKAQKYIPLAEDLARQTGKQPMVIPIEIGATGAVGKITGKAIKKLNGMGIPLQLSSLHSGSNRYSKYNAEVCEYRLVEACVANRAPQPFAGDDEPESDLVKQIQSYNIPK